jgi:hypothetical protein
MLTAVAANASSNRHDLKDKIGVLYCLFFDFFQLRRSHAVASSICIFSTGDIASLAQKRVDIYACKKIKNITWMNSGLLMSERFPQ